MIVASRIKEEFEIENIISQSMERMIKKCADIYQGIPEWVDANEHIKTINFAKSVCSETARLAMLGTSIKITGSKRADWMQEIIDKEYSNIRRWTEYACAYGTIVLRFNGNNVEFYTPDEVYITDSDSDRISGIVFVISEKVGKEEYYTKLEFQRFLPDGKYAISKRIYKGKSKNDLSEKVDIKKTPWNEETEEAVIENLKYPLFSVIKMPQANNIDIHSCLSLPVFAEAIEELKDLDIAYSRNAKEIEDSKRLLLLDSDRLLATGAKIESYPQAFENAKKYLGLPDMVKNVYGDGANTFYQEINPNINTDQRITGINALLSQLGYKCGFSNGYFVFNESSGIQTATGVEAEQQRTIQFIKDVRDRLEDCLKYLIYSMDILSDINDYAPKGAYEITCDFGDITYNREEDRGRWWNYVIQGKVPAWKYFEKFEGMTEEEAKKMIEEAKPKEPRLFGDEE